MTRRKSRRLRCAKNLVRRIGGRSVSDVDRYLSAADVVHSHPSSPMYQLNRFFREAYPADVLLREIGLDLTQA